MSKSNNGKVSIKHLIAGLLAGIAIALIYTTMNGYLGGKDLTSAWSEAAGSKDFWLGSLLAVICVVAAIWLVFPRVAGWIERPRAEQPRGAIWRRYRLILTIACAAGLPGLVAACLRLLADPHPRYDRLLFTGVVAVLLIVLIVYIWTVKPSDEKVEAIEKGQQERLADERQQQVAGKAAVSTLYIMMAVILLGGSAYDALVTRLWPARSLLEAALMFILWNIMYARWNKRI